MNKLFAIVLSVFVLIIIFMCATPVGRSCVNNWDNSIKEVDENTLYENRKMVEDTCRSMLSSYKSDVLIYEQYCKSENPEERSWAEQAKMRANRTAISYNEYILKNSHVWAENVPLDIETYLITY